MSKTRFNKYNPGGLVLHRRSRKDVVFEKAFGGAFGIPDEIKPLGRFAETEKSGIFSPPIFQDDIPSCVCCTMTAINTWFSYEEDGSAEHLSWPFLYNNSSPQANGTKPRIVADNLRLQGICEEKYYSVGALRAGMTADMSAWLNAKIYQIKNYSFITDRSPQGLYRALMSSPIAIGIGVNYSDFAVPGVIQKIKPPEFYHMVALWDVTKDGDYICYNWWNGEKQDVRVLSKDYPIEMAVSFKDLPDNISLDQVRTGLWESIKLCLKNQL